MSEKPLLQTESNYFNKKREEFLQKAPGKFVLIKGEEDFGFFDTNQTAYVEGVRRFGIEPFLIKPILPNDQIDEIPAFYLELLYATV